MTAVLLKLALGGFNILRLLFGALAKVARSLNAQGWIGLAVAAALTFLLVGQKGETRHWRKQSGQFERLYNRADQRFRREHLAFGRTVLNYRAAAVQAAAADKANAERVAAEQRAINERTSHDFEARIADARARADRLQSRSASADPGGGAGTAMPRLPAAAAGVDQATGEGGLPPDDALTATEQAIQLDELIKWVKRAAGIDVNGTKPPHQ